MGWSKALSLSQCFVTQHMGDEGGLEVCWPSKLLTCITAPASVRMHAHLLQWLQALTGLTSVSTPKMQLKLTVHTFVKWCTSLDSLLGHPEQPWAPPRHTIKSACLRDEYNCIAGTWCAVIQCMLSTKQEWASIKLSNKADWLQDSSQICLDSWHHVIVVHSAKMIWVWRKKEMLQFRQLLEQNYATG